MWKQLAFLLVCIALVHALPASSKDKFEKLAHALDDLVREEIEDELGAGGQGQSARRFYLIKAMKHPVSTGDSPLKGHKPQNDQKPGSQPQSTGRAPKPDVTGEPSKDEPFYEDKSDDKKHPPKGTGRPPVHERGFGGDQNKDGEKGSFKGTGKPPMDEQGKPNDGDDQRQGDSEPPKAKEPGVKDDESGRQGPTRPMEGAAEPPKDDKEVDDVKEGAMKNRFLKRVLVLLSNLR